MFNAIGVDVSAFVSGTPVASGMASVILGPLNLGRRPRKTFTLYNAGTVTLSGAIVQVNPDQGGQMALQGATPGAPQVIAPNPALWHTYDAASFQSLGAGQVRSLVASDLFRWWRIVGVNDQPAAIAASGWCYAASL